MNTAKDSLRSLRKYNEHQKRENVQTYYKLTNTDMVTYVKRHTGRMNNSKFKARNAVVDGRIDQPVNFALDLEMEMLLGFLCCAS